VAEADGVGAERADVWLAIDQELRDVAVWPSDTAPMDPKDVALAASGAPGSSGEGKATPLTAEAQESNQRLWWYALCVGLLFLGVDTVMSNRLAKT